MAVIQSPAFADQACSIALKTIQVTQPRHLLRESDVAARALRSSRAAIGRQPLRASGFRPMPAATRSMR
jgi:hypothetical protein